MGGSGFGILSPYPEHRNRDPTTSGTSTLEPLGQVTPPETPLLGVESQTGHSGAANDNQQGAEVAIRLPFETISVDRLPEWANGLGKWLYV